MNIKFKNASDKTNIAEFIFEKDIYYGYEYKFFSDIINFIHDHKKDYKILDFTIHNNYSQKFCNLVEIKFENTDVMNMFLIKII